nr:MAG TPA: hypothetical protein [Caudoviricetes sp.]
MRLSAHNLSNQPYRVLLKVYKIFYLSYIGPFLLYSMLQRLSTV